MSCILLKYDLGERCIVATSNEKLGHRRNLIWKKT
jgi:hypothetical protein